MFASDKDNERIVPRKKINFLKVGTQTLVVIFLLLYVTFDIFNDMLPQIPQVNFDNLTIYLLVMIFVMPLAVNLFGKWLQSKKWQALADQIGLRVEQANRFSIPTLTGTHRGHQVSIYQTAQRRGRSRVFFTNVQITLHQPSENSFEIKKRSMISLNQNKVGDDDFDNKYTTTTTDERLIDTILRTRRLRLGLLQLGERARTRTLTLGSTTLIYTEHGESSDTEYLNAVLGVLSELAHTIERYEQFN